MTAGRGAAERVAAERVPAAPGSTAAPGATASGVVIFACGAPMRGDDSVALGAVAGMDASGLTGAHVRLVGALAPEHLVDLPAGTSVVIVDAVVGVAPGRIVELGLHELAAHEAGVLAASTHQLPLGRVVALAQLLREEPLPGRFVGVGISDARLGASLSVPAAEALPAVRAAVARAVASLGAGSTLAGA